MILSIHIDIDEVLLLDKSKNLVNNSFGIISPCTSSKGILVSTSDSYLAK